MNIPHTQRSNLYVKYISWQSGKNSEEKMLPSESLILNESISGDDRRTMSAEIELLADEWRAGMERDCVGQIGRVSYYSMQ